MQKKGFIQLSFFLFISLFIILWIFCFSQVLSIFGDVAASLVDDGLYKFIIKNLNLLVLFIVIIFGLIYINTGGNQ